MVEVSLKNPQERFQEFFKIEKYRNLIKQMALTDRSSITIDFFDLLDFDSMLAKALLEKPEKFLNEYAVEALRSQLKIEDKEYAELVEKFYVRVKGLPEKTSLRSIGAKHVGKLISFDGIVVRSTPARPLLTEALFKCRCGQLISVPQDGLFIKRPLKCPNCARDKESGFELDVEKSNFISFQELRVQERPEELPPGQLPRYVDVFVVDELVDVSRPGDRVVVTGIVKARPEVLPGKGKLRSFLTYVEANNIETLGKELETIEISHEDEKKILEIAKRDFVHKDIIDSIAPSIYGYDDIKEAIMYLLFGGVSKTTPEGNTIRGDIHVLLIGDPGTAKSQLLKYVARIAPRGIYTSGRGTTAAGLTAAVLREKAGGMVLEAGALVLADKGVAAVDEIDKMRDEDRVAMHEMMEQQTVSVAKGGIVAMLNARTSILAAANPTHGRYEDRLSVADNINLPVVILSRFDLIFIQRDIPEKNVDEKLSEHILNVHRSGGVAVTPPIPPDLLRKYISYARAKIHPRLTDEAVNHLRQFYLKMRELSSGEGAPIAITPRQLEALIRITEARARAALREEATKMDAEAAIRIMEKSLRSIGVLKEEAGVADIDVLMTGKPATLRDKITTILTLVSEMEKESEKVNLEELYDKLAQKHGVDRMTAEDVIRRLIKEGTLYSPEPGYVKKARF
ncbi:MAG: minichromosome maintenance protein MCM [Candidatus Bathyarchaeota archaeon]